MDNRIRPVDAILAINSGSSSLKITVFERSGALSRRSAATVERIGMPGTRLSVFSGGETHDTAVGAGGVDTVLNLALHQMHEIAPFIPSAVGHRIVHGGSKHAAPARLTPALVADLHRLEPFDPIHMPQALAIVEAIGQRYPATPQVACFDTGFHRTMPPIAQMYPLKQSARDAGVQRYGFHGLSCESIVSALVELDGPAADGRLLIAHLGNGASVTAVHHGRSVDTTMGFSPTGGLMMGTRSGDLDPSVVTYLARTFNLQPDALERLVAAEAGLIGVSGISADMRDVLDRIGESPARDAVELYCYTARKHIGALAATVNGVDTIVFTGGIGEHAASIRGRLCAGLDYLGIRIDEAANAAGKPVISRADSTVTVRVMHTDEDLMIARHVCRLLT